MDPICYIRTMIRKWFAEPRPIALQSSILGILSPELILNICDFLPLESAALFSLSCTPIYRLLGKHLKTFKVDKNTRFKFLRILEKDLPGHITCEHCRKLHRIANAHYHHPSKRPYILNSADSGSHHPALRDKNRRWLQCWIYDGDVGLHLHLHPDFSSTIFRMAMKAYRQGQDCSDFLRLLSCEPKFRRRFLQYIGTARIVEGRMLWRDQEVHMSRATRGVWPEDRIIFICPHLEFYSMESFLNFQDTSPYLKQCKYCYTEFRIDFKCFGICHGIFVTKWKDFGTGYSTYNYKWTSHFSSFPDLGKAFFNPGSIFKAFQQEELSEFDFLSLLDPRNKKVMFDNAW